MATEEKKEDGSMKKLLLATAATFALGIGVGNTTAKPDAPNYASKDFGCSMAGQGCELVFSASKKPGTFKTVRVSFDGKVRANGNSTVLKASLPKSLTDAMKDFKDGKYVDLASLGD